jgi:hypothetical protein
MGFNSAFKGLILGNFLMETFATFIREGSHIFRGEGVNSKSEFTKISF